MRIILANPPWLWDKGHAVRAGSRWPHAEFDEGGDRTNYAPFPFFIAYTAAVLEKMDQKVKVLDALSLGWDMDKFLREVEKFNPNLVIMETSTPSINQDLKTAEMVKNKSDSKIALCGPHVTTYPDEILKNKQIDFVFLGEYEYTARDTVVALESGRDLSDVLGAAFRDNGNISMNKKRDLIHLDELPSPARHLFKMEYYCDPFAKMPSVQLIASRGCTYGCIYCLWPQAMYGGRNYRFRSAKNVVDEIEEIIKEYNPKQLYFDDDTFNLNKQKVVEFCNEYMERGISKEWSAMCSPIPVTRKILELMHKSGCEGLKFGVESGSEKILRKAGRTTQKLDHVKNVFRWCREIGIRTHATFMIGLPGEAKETMKETFDFLMDINPDSYQISVATPLPGTQYYNTMKEKGHILAEKWDDFANIHYIFDNPVIKTEELSAEDIKKASVYANRELMSIFYKRKEREKFFSDLTTFPTGLKMLFHGLLKPYKSILYVLGLLRNR